MLEHVVIFQARAGRESDLTDELRAFSDGITGTLPGLIGLSWGENTNGSGLERGYTHACHVRLADGAFDAYRAHPAHRTLLGRLDELCRDRFAIDYPHHAPPPGAST